MIGHRTFGGCLGEYPQANHRPPVQHGWVADDTVHLRIDVRREGGTISGTVTTDRGTVRRFSGRLGLFSVVDDEIERPPPEVPIPPE
jgi:hypothetical protein